MGLVDIQHLTVEYETTNGPLRAVDDVDISINEGEIVGIVGESGCGKTTLTKAILGLLDDNGMITQGSVLFDGNDLTNITNSELNSLRWGEISYIIQNAMNALNPVHKIESQFVEVIQTHTDLSRKEAKERTERLLKRVGIDASRANDYPHELSGGQRQRVVIALALVLRPPLVIADEPTTGLDVVTQAEILDHIRHLQQELGNTMMIVTHDTSVIAEIADRVVVMYGGEIVEIGNTHEVFNKSAHPYTMGLTNAFPKLKQTTDRLVSIPGSPPNLTNPPSGCRFANRCPFQTEKCEMDPPLDEVTPTHQAKCHYTDQSSEFRKKSQKHETWSEENKGASQ